ncbi:hypothetical protein A8D93_18220 [Burkholderia cenocepacia]|nr:hypothetical protein A8D93_18220 [Burkholderia cenocepacia]
MEPVRQVLSRRHGASRPCGLGLRCECLASLITGTFDFFSAKETLINEPVVRITDEAGCNFQIDVGI